MSLKTHSESEDPPKTVAGKVRRTRKFDWDRLFDGEEHRLVAGEDFWTSVRNFQSQVSQMAKSRGVKVSTRSDVLEARSKQAPKRIVWVKASGERTVTRSAEVFRNRTET